MKKTFLLTLVGALVLTVQSFAATASVETLKNLNAAYRGESNANNRYTAFAKKAETEGYAQVAKLFRAAASAEAIHRDTHKATIVKLGGTVDQITLDAVNAGTTADNLAEAIKGESYERDTMYPAFLKLAKAENNRDAERSFHFAVAAEKEHAALYTEALAQLGKNAVVEYYVCPVCGDTTVGRPTKDKCATCRTETSKFVSVK
jgi:rubrerythrin